MKQSIINMCLMISVYFLVDKLRRLIAYDRQSSVNVTDDWRTFSDKSLSIGTSNLSGVGIIVNCPMLPPGILVANAIVHSNSTLGRYTGMYFTVTYWGAHINHGIHSNTVLTEVFEGYSLQTTKPIRRGEELLIDYVTLPFFYLPTIATMGLRSSGAAGEKNCGVYSSLRCLHLLLSAIRFHVRYS